MKKLVNPFAPQLTGYNSISTACQQDI